MMYEKKMKNNPKEETMFRCATDKNKQVKNEAIWC